MLNLVPPNDCLRARESASARLDGELSELGAARLAAHLRACDECRAYASELESVAGLLRAAPLELPETEFALPVRRRVPALQIAAVAAAAVAVAAGSSFALGRALGTSGASTATGAAVTSPDTFSVQADSTQQHILAMVRRLERHDTLRFGDGLIAL
jgi:predicted anti-sigma-YlaC factor YlaD